MSQARRLAVLGEGLWRTGNLAALLDDCELFRVAPLRTPPPALDAVLAWGRRPSAARARAWAQARGLPVLQVEDGFLRSVRLGADAPPLSVVLDDLGIYYDAREPSRLEALVRAGVDEAGATRAENLRAAWRRAGVSKYNHARDPHPEMLPEDYVLVVDQTAGDESIVGGLADASSFARMLAAALDEHPGCTVLLKVHPDVVAGRKQGHFDLRALAMDARVRIVADAVHPVPLLARARAVYVVTSQLGFEALLHGRPVRVFGMPFYAGWGLTRDDLPAPARRAPATLDALAHAALVAYPRYIDPDSGARCEPERLVEWMALQRQTAARFPPRLYARNFSPWKLPVLRRFLSSSDVVFPREGLFSRATAVPAGSDVAVWGRPPEGQLPQAARTFIVEDGFLRSVGLGADLVEPVSWVIDDVGIYYDATRPSRLELILQDDGAFDDALRARAADLRVALCAAGITKYNLAGARWLRPATAKRVLLVPGQVESDASIAWGAPALRRNLELLRAVREENPDAWLVYKPHPDVVAGVRRPGAGEEGAAAFCDEVVTDAPMHVLLDAVDELHVLTSLAGFEALLRGKPVTCWGQPFYAGWGLTRDRAPVARRTRRRTLDELVAATLILYPLYVGRRGAGYTTPEQALRELIAWRENGADALSPWRRAKRLFMQLRARVQRV